MKKSTFTIILVLAAMCSNHTLFAQNVGIGTSAPTQKLHVAGNERLDGAFMPNNLPGNTGQLLTSAGAGIAPTWGAIINRWTTVPYNLNANTIYDLTVTGVTCTETSSIFVNLWGSWVTPPNVTINYVEAQVNQVHFRVTNNALLTNYVGMDFIIGIIR